MDKATRILPIPLTSASYPESMDDLLDTIYHQFSLAAGGTLVRIDLLSSQLSVADDLSLSDMHSQWLY